MHLLIPTACQYGRYGLNCSLDCGHCIDSTNCNHVNGTCTLGCAPGWQNLDKCVTRKYRFHFLYDIVYMMNLLATKHHHQKLHKFV